jgi:hypothetical protein
MTMQFRFFNPMWATVGSNHPLSQHNVNIHLLEINCDRNKSKRLDQTNLYLDINFVTNNGVSACYPSTGVNSGKRMVIMKLLYVWSFNFLIEAYYKVVFKGKFL